MRYAKEVAWRLSGDVVTARRYLAEARVVAGEVLTANTLNLEQAEHRVILAPGVTCRARVIHGQVIIEINAAPQSPDITAAGCGFIVDGPGSSGPVALVWNAALSQWKKLLASQFEGGLTGLNEANQVVHHISQGSLSISGARYGLDGANRDVSFDAAIYLDGQLLCTAPSTIYGVTLINNVLCAFAFGEGDYILYSRRYKTSYDLEDETNSYQWRTTSAGYTATPYYWIYPTQAIFFYNGNGAGLVDDGYSYVRILRAAITNADAAAGTASLAVTLSYADSEKERYVDNQGSSSTYEESPPFPQYLDCGCPITLSGTETITSEKTGYDHYDQIVLSTYLGAIDLLTNGTEVTAKTPGTYSLFWDNTMASTQLITANRSTALVDCEFSFTYSYTIAAEYSTTGSTYEEHIVDVNGVQIKVWEDTDIYDSSGVYDFYSGSWGSGCETVGYTGCFTYCDSSGSDPETTSICNYTSGSRITATRLLLDYDLRYGVVLYEEQIPQSKTQMLIRVKMVPGIFGEEEQVIMSKTYDCSFCNYAYTAPYSTTDCSTAIYDPPDPYLESHYDTIWEEDLEDVRNIPRLYDTYPYLFRDTSSTYITEGLIRCERNELCNQQLLSWHVRDWQGEHYQGAILSNYSDDAITTLAQFTGADAWFSYILPFNKRKISL